MMENKAQKINLVGGGLVGSLLSLFLARRGIEVEVYERRPDMRTHAISAGRSINLALSTRGIHALHQMGLEKEVLELAIPMVGRMVHGKNGETNLQRYGRNDNEYINSISRGDLNKLLMNKAEETGRVEFFFDKTISSAKSFESVTIGTDGSASAIRGEIAKSTGVKPSEELLDYGYKELIIPAGPQGKFLLEKNALHIWPRGTFMLIALPNLDGSFTATLFLPFTGENSFENLNKPVEVETFFRENFADVVPLFPNLAEEFFEHPTGHMITVKTAIWSHKNALLMGDAAHAIVPFFGQGMNCGFEDCTVFDQILSGNVHRRQSDWEKIFQKFYNARKQNTDAIAEMAVENFVEMRDKVAQPKFVMEKAIERVLSAQVPDYISRYQLVTFTRVPYTVASTAGIITAEILEELGKGLSSAEDVDLELAQKLVATKLTPYLKEYRKESYGFKN